MRDPMEILTLALVTLLAQAPEISERVHKKIVFELSFLFFVFFFLLIHKFFSLPCRFSSQSYLRGCWVSHLRFVFACIPNVLMSKVLS